MDVDEGEPAEVADQPKGSVGIVEDQLLLSTQIFTSFMTLLTTLELKEKLSISDTAA
jgi:hypothetical protein